MRQQITSYLLIHDTWFVLELSYTYVCIGQDTAVFDCFVCSCFPPQRRLPTQESGVEHCMHADTALLLKSEHKNTITFLVIYVIEISESGS